MVRCHKTSFYATQSDIDKLFSCNRISAEIWNSCLDASKAYHLSNGGKWINRSELQSAMKGKFPLHSQSIQAVCHKYLYARESARASRLKGEKNKYPYKHKKNFNTKWIDKAFKIYTNGKIELSLGMDNGKQRKPITIMCKHIPIGDIKEIELIYDRGLMISICYDDLVPKIEANGSNRAGVDLGEIHSIAAFNENGESLIITGRKIRSIHRLRNKKLAELQKLMSRCKKGSRKWNRYRSVEQFVLSKSARQIEDALHKTSRNFTNWCKVNSTCEVAVGKIDGIQRGTKGKISKITSQKLSNWSFGKLQYYMNYKLKACGITMLKINESYTTQTCPVCGDRKISYSRNYRCKCGYSCHRDIHGARNILSKHLNGGDIVYVADIKNQKYLRIA